MDVTVRAWVPEDQEAVWDLVSRCLREFGFEPDPETSEADLHDVESYYRGGVFLVATDPAGRLLGTTGIAILDPNTAKLRKMYVDPSFRGKGVGRLLLNSAVDFARSKGMREVLLETTEQMAAARRLYESYGFVQVEGEAASPRCHLLYRLVL